jgi:zinc D-Ala-D-Ala carboxypeptidase
MMQQPGPGTGRLQERRSLRWLRLGFYVLALMSLAGLLLRLTAGTASLAREANLAPPTASMAHATAVVPATALVTHTPPATATGLPPTPAITATPTLPPAATLTAADQGPCELYDQVPADLLTVVDRSTGLPRDYEPPDLAIVPLDPRNEGYRPVALRQVVHKPLLDMLDAMNQAGLKVWVMSGFRSYGEQQMAYEKWLQMYPDRAEDISAVPGHSEHQLGTAIDFTTRAMVDEYGDFFHINFIKTAEGEWLSRHAVYYGFTLSYPDWAVEHTRYAWEPWHYRYVGILAQELDARIMTLTQYLQQCAPR